MLEKFILCAIIEMTVKEMTERNDSLAQVLIKAGSFIFFILLGYFLKKIHFLRPTDYRLVSKLLLNVALPGAVVVSFSELQALTGELLLMVLLGLSCNWIILAITMLFARKTDGKTKAYLMNTTPGYNIGCFTMPYVQSFLGSYGVVVTCLFDTGNSIMCTGGTYAIASGLCGAEGLTVRGVAKRMVTSVPMLAYVSMLVITLLGWKVPEAVVSIASIAAGANSFLAMMMIGLLLEFKITKENVRPVLLSLIIRYGMAIIFSVICYNWMPFSFEVRKVLSLIVFAPVTSLAGIFTERCGGDGAVVAMTNSVSIVISVTVMTVMMVLFFS